MGNKINIAELLKDCPNGMELDCTTWENVTFEKVVNDRIYIKRNSKIPLLLNDLVILDKYGRVTEHSDEKCRIFPKGKTTWEGFQRPFKDGDIVTFDNPTENHLQIFIFKDKKENNTLSSCYLMLDGDKLVLEEDLYYVTRLATEKEKQKLFDAIKENGYHWNTETKTLEKLPKFKVGDKIKEKTGIWASTRTIRDYVKGIGYYTTINDCVRIDDQDNWELVVEKPIFKVGDKIRDTRNNSEGVIQKLTDEGYECHFEYGNFLISFKEQHYFILVLDKFDITTLEPFESRVLVRDNDHDSWKPSFWGYLRGGEIMYDTVRGVFRQCIPYESNEHLMNTTNDCGEFFKTWEK